jgi:hypothetical protein
VVQLQTVLQLHWGTLCLRHEINLQTIRASNGKHERLRSGPSRKAADRDCDVKLAPPSLRDLVGRRRAHALRLRKTWVQAKRNLTGASKTGVSKMRHTLRSRVAFDVYLRHHVAQVFSTRAAHVYRPLVTMRVRVRLSAEKGGRKC